MNVKQQVDREITRRQVAAREAAEREAKAKEAAERQALTEQYTARAEAAKARVQAEAIEPTVADFAEMAGAPAQWMEGLIAWVETGKLLGEKQTAIFNQYGQLAFALGRRFGELRRGGEYDREQINDMARQCLDSEFAKLQLWPDGLPTTAAHPFGISVDRGSLYRHMQGRMYDGLRST